MSKHDLLLLSASELADYEREAHDKHQRTVFSGQSTDLWALRFLRLLTLHRATERQSAILQSQVRLLESENAKLEAALDAALEAKP